MGTIEVYEVLYLVNYHKSNFIPPLFKKKKYFIRIHDH